MKNIFLALFLSLTLTVTVAAGYLLYPLPSLPPPNIDVPVSSGTSDTFSITTIERRRVSLRNVAFLELIFFLAIFGLLQRRSAK